MFYGRSGNAATATTASADASGAASADAASTELAESRHRQLPSCQSRHPQLVLPKLLIPRGVLRPQWLVRQIRLFSFVSPIDIDAQLFSILAFKIAALIYRNDRGFARISVGQDFENWNPQSWSGSSSQYPQ
jgi:hypothetical protein